MSSVFEKIGIEIMNVKKILKKQAQKDLRSIETDGDREFLLLLKSSVSQKDYCLTCRLPASKCKGACTLEERKRNGG